MKSTKKLINDPSQTKIWKHKHVVKLQVSAKPEKPSVKKIRPLLPSNTLDHQLVKGFATQGDKRKKALISEAFQLEKTNENKLITLHLFNLYVDGLIRNGYFKHCKEEIEFITAFNVCYFQVKPLGDDGNWVLEQWCDHYREMAISKAIRSQFIRSMLTRFADGQAFTQSERNGKKSISEEGWCSVLNKMLGREAEMLDRGAEISVEAQFRCPRGSAIPLPPKLLYSYDPNVRLKIKNALEYPNVDLLPKWHPLAQMMTSFLLHPGCKIYPIAPRLRRCERNQLFKAIQLTQYVQFPTMKVISKEKPHPIAVIIRRFLRYPGLRNKILWYGVRHDGLCKKNQLFKALQLNSNNKELGQIKTCIKAISTDYPHPIAAIIRDAIKDYCETTFTYTPSLSFMETYSFNDLWSERMEWSMEYPLVHHVLAYWDIFDERCSWLHGNDEDYEDGFIGEHRDLIDDERATWKRIHQLLSPRTDFNNTWHTWAPIRLEKSREAYDDAWTFLYENTQGSD